LRDGDVISAQLVWGLTHGARCAILCENMKKGVRHDTFSFISKNYTGLDNHLPRRHSSSLVFHAVPSSENHTTRLSGEVAAGQAKLEVAGKVIYWFADKHIRLKGENAELKIENLKLVSQGGELEKLLAAAHKENEKQVAENRRLVSMRAQTNGVIASAILASEEEVRWRIEVLNEALVWALSSTWIDMKEGAMIKQFLPSGNVVVLQVRDDEVFTFFYDPSRR